MIIIDYRGFRLLATSLLPISSTSLRYGSADGGLNVRCEPEAAEVFARAARTLNLKVCLSNSSARPYPSTADVMDQRAPLCARVPPVGDAGAFSGPGDKPLPATRARGHRGA